MGISELKKCIFRKDNIGSENNFFGKFQFLTPSKNAEKVSEYIDALNEALKESDVKNIAISGSYGAGKSSFIKTFENKNSNSNYNFLDISLATFQNNNKDMSLVEKSILQQIFYKVEQKDIPQSRFKRINIIGYLKLKALFAVLFILALLLILESKYITSLSFFKNFKPILLPEWTGITTQIDLKIISFLIILIGTFLLVKSIIKDFTGLTLEKFNLQNLEIKTHKEDETSLLNNYLDEILYFFSKTKYNIVVFQDLDRFDNLEIFTKLRELNNYINNSKQVKRKVVFIYAVKDDMFKSDAIEDKNSRTKFFDFMIPIIPYINSSTSYDKLLEFFDSDLSSLDEVIEKLDKELKKESSDKEEYANIKSNKLELEQEKEEFRDFLRDISLYIKDMRLLKNIYNEYLIYNEKIGDKLNKTKLLAMMVYKNFYPNDFHLLHKDQGLVFSTFKSKTKYIKAVDQKYMTNIGELQSQIKQVEHERNDSVNDLRKTYLYTIIEHIKNNPPYLVVDNTSIYYDIAIEDDKFEKIKKSNTIRHPSHSHLNITFKSVEDELSPLSYDEREKLIIDKKNNITQDLNEQIQELKQIQKDLNTKTINQLCVIREIKNKIREELENKDLLQYLICNGHIDENYYMFLSYSFNKSLTPSDTEFFKSVINNSYLGQEYKLVNIKELVNKLKITEFQSKSILINDLVSFLLTNKEDYKEQITAIFQQLSDHSKESISFIFKYIEALPENNGFITEVSKLWEGFWSYIYETSDLTLKEKENHFYLLLYNVPLDVIKSLNKQGYLKTYIEGLIKLKDLVEEDNKKFQKIIKVLGVKFKNLSEPISNTSLFTYIYENNFYVLNRLMIEQIIYTRYAKKDEIEQKLGTSHLTTIKALDKDKKLIENIEQHISQYIDDIFLTIESNKNESEETIIWLLNSEELTNDQKNKIIDSQDIMIDGIDKIKNNDLLDILFEKNKVKATWDNISFFYNLTKELRKPLINYLSFKDNAEELSKTRINTKYCDEHENFDTQLLKDVLECNDIDTSSYEMLIKANGYWYESLNICNVGDDKVETLVNGGKLQLTRENIENLIQCSLSKQIMLIEKEFNTFIENFNDLYDLLSNDDFTKLIESSNLTDDNKFELLDHMDITSIEMDEKLALFLSELFLKNKKAMNSNLLKIILSQLPEHNKLEVLVFQLAYKTHELNCNKIDELLNLLGSPYDKLCKYGNTYVKIDTNQNNKTLVEILNDEECISSFSVKDKYIRVNRFRG